MITNEARDEKPVEYRQPGILVVLLPQCLPYCRNAYSGTRVERHPHAECLLPGRALDVDDLQLRLVHAAIEMIEEHLLGQRRALAQREQLEHLVFLAGQMHARAVDFDRLGVEVDHEIAGLDDRLGMALGAPHDGVDARHQLVLSGTAWSYNRRRRSRDL